MKLNFLNCAFLFNIFIFSDITALPTDFEQQAQKVISSCICSEKEHGDTKFFEISEQKLKDLCERLEDESEKRFDLIEESIRQVYVHCENIKPESSFLDFMEGFYELLKIAFVHIPGIEKNPNNLLDYYGYVEDYFVEREKHRLSVDDMNAIEKRIEEKGGSYPGDQIFAEIELRREGIIKDRK